MFITKKFCGKIARGGFGTVYLGSLRNSVMVAVKKLHTSREVSDKQFLEEVKCLKTVNHKNVVRFLGYCAYTQGEVMDMEGKVIMAEEHQKFLCFEYAPNGNLQNYLEEKPTGYEWSIRYKIIKGICQGLHYLHRIGIKHLDLKPENVLLGAEMEPKITDFGLSRNDGTKSTIKISKVMGTLGYIAPELIKYGKISFKSDIYSLGIIIIRLLIGSHENIPENWHESLNIDSQQKERCIEIAQLCSDDDPDKRPTISDIISKLTKTETTNHQNVSPIIITEPRNDPTSTLYKKVKIFLAHHYRGEEELPVDRPKWKLAFEVPPKFPIIAGENVRDANGKPLRVILVDTATGKPLPAPPAPGVLRIELVSLLGNFPREWWDPKDFQRGIVNYMQDQREKQPVLAGEYRPTMWDGSATVNELMFTDCSTICGCMFRIGVRILPGSYDGDRILEGMSQPFMIRERHCYELHRNINYKWQLAFLSPPEIPVDFSRQIRDVIGNPLEVILVDSETGLPSAPPPKVELHIQLVSLFLLHPSEAKALLTFLPDKHDWSSTDQFQRSVNNSRGLELCLSGDVSLTMKADGRVTANELKYEGSLFTDCFAHIGVFVVPGSYNGGLGTIREGITNDFQVQDSRQVMVTKSWPPGLGDELWRLDDISWGGVAHRRMEKENVRNVQDFLRMLAVKPDELRAIVGNGVADHTWSDIIENARGCVYPGDKVYAYSMAHVTIYVDSIFGLAKVELDGVECPRQQLDEAQKRLVQQAMLEAYQQRHNLGEVKLTLKLAFKSQPRLPIHTGSRIVDATGNPLEVILVDAKTGLQWDLPMELRIAVEPLFGDFPPYDGKDWSAEEFEAAIVKGRQEDVKLLKSDYLYMRDGHHNLNELQFTDDSSWVRCRKFRIGAHVVIPRVSRVIEAMTEAFVVEDLNRKHYPPVLGDPVWRLEMIDKEGAPHKKLRSNKIDTVQEFVRMLNVKPRELRAIVGDAMMTDEMWFLTVDHAKHCKPGDKVYAYSGERSTIYVDSVFSRLLKIEIDAVLMESSLINTLFMKSSLLQMQRSRDESHAVRLILRHIILEAYEHRHNLQEVNAKMEELLDDHTLPDIKNLLRSTQGYMQDHLDDEARTDSSWVHCLKFLDLVIPRGVFRIIEAMTKAFVVQDLNRKHYPPVLGDPVWRLEMIDKEGEPHRRLTSINVDTVQEFVRMLNVKPRELHAIVGDSMTYEMWHLTVNHAKHCKPGYKVYAYRGANSTIYIDSLFSRLLKIHFNLALTKSSLLQRSPPKSVVARLILQHIILEAYEHRHKLHEVNAGMEELLDQNGCDIKKLLYSTESYMRDHLDDEASTEASVARDLNRKHYPPITSDPVWRLEMIDKEGAAHRKLTSNNIDTVQEFVRMLNVKPQELYAIVGDAMPYQMWLIATSHAEVCDPGDKVYAYRGANSTIYVDSVFTHLLKIEINGVRWGANVLFNGKANIMIARQLILEAYEHRRNLQEIDADMEPLLKDCLIQVLLYCYLQDNHDDEASTEASVAGDPNRKHYPPIPSDPVWRLEMIDKEGAAHRKLMSNNIDTVQEFVRMLNVKPEELHAIVGDAMTYQMWYIAVKHANYCNPGDKVYVYSRVNSTIYIDSVFNLLLKIEIHGVECQWDGLFNSKAKIMAARQIILDAYENRHNLQEIDADKEELRDNAVGSIEELLSCAYMNTFSERLGYPSFNPSLYPWATNDGDDNYLDIEDDDDLDVEDGEDEDDDQALPIVHNNKVEVPEAANMGDNIQRCCPGLQRYRANLT